MVGTGRARSVKKLHGSLLSRSSSRRAVFRPWSNPANAAPGTIRGDYGVSRSYNLVHGSDSPDAAARELGLFFPEGLVKFDYAAVNWIYDPVEELKK